MIALITLLYIYIYILYMHTRSAHNDASQVFAGPLSGGNFIRSTALSTLTPHVSRTCVALPHLFSTSFSTTTLNTP